MTLLGNIEYVVQLNRTGITHLASGQLESAKATFRDALAAAMADINQDNENEVQDIDYTEEGYSKGLLPAFEAIPVKAKRMDDSTTSCSADYSFYDYGRNPHQDTNNELARISTSGTRMKLYNRAFLLSHVNNSDAASHCYAAVLLFNLALTFQLEAHAAVQQWQKQARSSTLKAIKLYNMAIDLIADAPATHALFWKIMIAAIFNKGCALCDLTQWELARQVVADLTHVLSGTTSRPPDFEEEAFHELHLQSLMDGSLIRHASAA